MAVISSNSANRIAALPSLQPLESFVRQYVEQTGGVWDEIEPQVYDLLLENEAVRITFDPEALPEHPSAQLASLGSPLMDRLLADARQRGAYTVLYAGGLNSHPHDLAARLRRAYTVPDNAALVPTRIRVCYFPQAVYHFVVTFISDRKEQTALTVALDLHSSREVRHLARLEELAPLTGRPAEGFAEAPHLSVHTGFGLACQQVARSITPLANQRRRELLEHTGRQIDRVERYYAQMLDELDQQPQHRAGTTGGEAAARKKSRIEAIQRERQLRVTELKQKSVLKATLALTSVQVIHLPKLLVKFDLVSQKGKTAQGETVFDLLTEAFEPIQLRPGGRPTFDLGPLVQ